MSDTTVLMETIAAAMLDGLTLSFTPSDADGTRLPTGFVLGVRHEGRGGVHLNTCELGFGELVTSGAPDKLLTEAIVDTMQPVIDAVVDDGGHAVALL